MKALSIDQIEQARFKILENARELIDEAELLLEKKRFARTYALAHLGCEELAKIPMLVRAATDTAVGSPVDWPKLFKRLCSHSEKIKGILCIDFLVDPETENDADIKRLWEEIKRTPDYNRSKNSALYTSLVGEDFLKPSELILPELATSVVKLARRRLGFFEETEQLMRGKTEEIARSPEYRELRRRFVDPLLSRNKKTRRD
jgi:AbiV family abortive infection protein